MSEIKIQNMPELEDGYEYSFGKRGGLGGWNWQVFANGRWNENYTGDLTGAFYRRPLPKPEPEPEQ